MAKRKRHLALAIATDIEEGPRVTVSGWTAREVFGSSEWRGDDIFDLIYGASDGTVFWLADAEKVIESVYCWLLENGFTCRDSKDEETFFPFISGTGVFYKMKVRTEEACIEFRDVCRKTMSSVPSMAESLGLPYTGHARSETLIISRSVRHLMRDGLHGLTVGADAISELKKSMGGETKYRSRFPELDVEIDKVLRLAYRGGWCHIAERARGVDIGYGVRFDVNSLYPKIMRDCLLPFGIPLPFDGAYEKNLIYPLFIQGITCAVKLKDGAIPWVQDPADKHMIHPEYVRESDGLLDLWLTSVELELLYKTYDVTVASWNGGYAFLGTTGIFDEYIEAWFIKKQKATGATRLHAKMMLNTAAGKLAKKTEYYTQRPRLEADGSIAYDFIPPDKPGKPEYTAAAAFITAYARTYMIKVAMAQGDRFLYCDTDSLHLQGTADPVKVPIHPKALGAFSREAVFTRARFIHAKTYVEEVVEKDGILLDEPIVEITAAGLPESAREGVGFDEFREGASLPVEVPVHLPGGVAYETRYFML